MTTRARRPLAIVAVFALLLTSAPLALAAEPAAPTTGLSQSNFAPHKHPTLDSQLVELVNDVKTGALPAAMIAGKATLSQGESVAVTIRLDGGSVETAAWLAARGADVGYVNVDTIEAFVPVGQLEALAGREGVSAVRALIPPAANVTSQGVGIHGSPHWNANGFSGAGVKVGVIDTGFGGVTSLVGSELPQVTARCYVSIAGAPTANPADCESGDVHGTAVAETVLDIAPQVTLYISNPPSYGALADTVAWMVSQGVTIINHSVGWTWDGPGDGTSTYSNSPLKSVDSAIANGITWVNAAGNSGLATWTGGYSDANGDDFLEFEGSSDINGFIAEAGQSVTIMMRWDDSWTNASRDLDLGIFDSGLNLISAGAEEQSGGSGDIPFEVVQFTAPATDIYYVAINHFAGANPSWIQVQSFSGHDLEFASPNNSITNPAESANPGLLAVGAASWMSPGTIEDFSSQGPTRDGRVKPDVVGIDQADTVSYGPSGFPGTSQASPHVAGMAALVKQRFPHYGPVEVANYLRQNATQAGAPNNVWGHGLTFLPEIVQNENPVPSLGSLAPSTITVGASATIAVNGGGFIQGSVVRWNGQDRPTTYVSPSQLTFTTQAGDTAAAGSAQITVFNPAPGGGVSNALPLTIAPDTGPGNPVDYPEFERTRTYTDEPVAQGQVSRTWIWGTVMQGGLLLEPYTEAAGGHRSVKYHDKSRMEVTHPNNDNTSVWYVTNGLLVVEMMTGQMQMGDATFEPRGPAQVPVAGDTDDVDGPTYATFAVLRDAAPYANGATITQRVDRAGVVTNDPSLASHNVTAAHLVEVPGIRHQVASPFWTFMNSSGVVYQNGGFLTAPLFENAFFATGLPVTEAYWARVKLGGEYRDVLMQCFERRCLTYAPGNPAGWQVEAGNVGLHYYIWRYQTDHSPSEPPPPPPPPTPAPPVNGVPSEGGVLFQSNLGDLPEQEFDSGAIGGPTEAGDAYILAAPSEGAQGLIIEGPFGNASYSLDVFSIASTGRQQSCLFARYSQGVGSYELCLAIVDGEAVATWAYYVNWGDSGTLVPLGAFVISPPESPERWFRLKMIAYDNQFWFFVDGGLVGTASHTGTASGDVGFALYCTDEASACGSGFTNLVVRAVTPAT